ncbi:hypothetical protein QQ045_015286 [Rhodiola kirilowii]
MQQPQLPPKEYHRVSVRRLLSNFNTNVIDSSSKNKLSKVANVNKQYKSKAKYAELMELLQAKPGVRSHAMVARKYAHVDYGHFVAQEYTVEAYNTTCGYHFSLALHKGLWRPYKGLHHVPNSEF